MLQNGLAAVGLRGCGLALKHYFEHQIWVFLQDDGKTSVTAKVADVNSGRKHLIGMTYTYDLKVPAGSYDLALSFLRVGCLIGKETADITEYVGRLYRSLRRGGSLFTIEIEKADNMFARILFEDILRLKESPGLEGDELRITLEREGFKPIEVTSRSGLLYVISLKT